MSVLAAPPPHLFVKKRVVLQNLSRFRKLCLKSRVQEVNSDQQAALAGFHKLIAKTVGIDSSELKNDRFRVTEERKLGILNDVELGGMLEEMGFLVGVESDEEPNGRMIGKIDPLSQFLQYSLAPSASAPKTRFSTFSGGSAWGPAGVGA